MFGQLVVVATHRPYYIQTENPNNILGTFSTISSLDKGTPESRKATLPLMASSTSLLDHSSLSFGALGLTKHFFGAEVAGLAQKLLLNKEASLMLPHQQQNWLYHKHTLPGLGIAHLALGFLCYGSCYVTWRSYWTWFELLLVTLVSFGPRLPSKVYLGRAQR